MPPRFSDDLKTQRHHINKGFLRSSENKRSKKADCLPKPVGRQSASIVKRYYAFTTFGFFAGNLPRVSTISLACSAIMS